MGLGTDTCPRLQQAFNSSTLQFIMKRAAFFISDSTGITAETLGHSLLTQFPQFEFEQRTIPYVNSEEKAHEVLDQINAATEKNQAKSLIFSTLAQNPIREIVKQADGLFMDFFDLLMGPLETELQAKYAHDIGKFHSILDTNRYDQRIAAVEFALNTDDGVGLKHYEDADVILVGVSRCGKTPTCLYMALVFGILAANYPITEEDMGAIALPKPLRAHADKVFGLTIDVDRLQAIRTQRRADSIYASKEQCQKELDVVQKIYRNYGIPYLDSTAFSIEELATKIMAKKGIQRRLY